MPRGVRTPKPTDEPKLAEVMNQEAGVGKAEPVMPASLGPEDLKKNIQANARLGASLQDEDFVRESVAASEEGAAALEAGDFVTLDELEGEYAPTDSETMREIDEAVRELQGAVNEECAPPSLPVLLFSNLVFRSGINMTVRRGTKWAGTRGLAMARYPAEAVQIRESLGHASDSRFITIHDTLVVPFFSLNEGRSYHGMLNFEHDPNCHNYYHLARVMREVYQPETPTSQGGFNATDLVTLVFFTVD